MVRGTTVWILCIPIFLLLSKQVLAAPSIPLLPSWGAKVAKEEKLSKQLGWGVPDMKGGVVSDIGYRAPDGSNALEVGMQPITRLQLVRRAIFLAYAFFLPLCFSGLGYFNTWFRENVWYRLLVNSISMCGAGFIKWGQWSSTRPDMFPEPLCKLLARLHSNAPKHSREHTRRLVERAFGNRSLESTFDYFGIDPIASGSIAQVHKAVLNGVVVAVKVRHPNVKEQMALDFRLMRALADWADSSPAFRWMNLGPSVQQFSGTMGAQTWLDVEARHLNIFNRNFRSWPDVGFPRAICTTEDILVESWEEGILVSKYLAKYGKGRHAHTAENIPENVLEIGERSAENDDVTREEEKEKVAPGPQVDAAIGGSSGDGEFQPVTLSNAHFLVTSGEDTYLKMLLVDNVLHGDLHPGNILLQLDQYGKPKLILLDAGMVAQLVREEQDNFIGLLTCMGLGDGEAAGKVLIKFSADQSACADVHAFVHDVDLLFKDCCRGYGTNVDVGEVLRGVLTLMRKHSVRVDVNYATLLINALCLDAMAAALLPGYNILDGAQTMLTLYGKASKGGGFWIRRILPIVQKRKQKHDRWAEANAEIRLARFTHAQQDLTHVVQQ